MSEISNEINLNSPEIFLPRVQNLDHFELVDDVPNIQFTPLSIVMETTSLQNPISYADHSAFITQFGSEMEQIAKIDEIVEHGQVFVHMLYTFRSVSRAIPMVVSVLFERTFMFFASSPPPSPLLVEY
jgi:hypothetical protein